MAAKERREMKILAILTLTVTLLSCSQYYHAKQSKKHAQKAISKGATVTDFGTDTLVLTNTITKTDTLIQRDTVDNVITVTKIVTKEVLRVDTVKVFIYKTIEAKSKTETRQENKTERSKAKQETKQVKSDNNKDKSISKNNRKVETSKNRIWLWIVLAFITGYLIRYLTYGSTKFTTDKK